MILKWMSLGIPVAGFFAAGVIAAEAGPATAPEAAPAAEATAEADRKTVRVKVVRIRKDGDAAKGEVREEKSGTTVVIDADEIAREVEDTVEEALSSAMDALDDLESDIRVELDGKKLERLTDEHRKALAEAREKLKGMGEKLSEHAAEVEVRVTRAAEEAAEAARKAGESLKEYKVIILRERDGDSEVKIEKDDQGRTVVIIEGDDVKVLTPKTREDRKSKTRKE